MSIKISIKNFKNPIVRDVPTFGDADKFFDFPTIEVKSNSIPIEKRRRKHRKTFYSKDGKPFVFPDERDEQWEPTCFNDFPILNHIFDNWNNIYQREKQQLGGTKEFSPINFQKQVNQEQSRRSATASDKLRFDFTPTQPPTLYDALNIIPTRHIKPVNEIPSYIKPSKSSSDVISWYDAFMNDNIKASDLFSALKSNKQDLSYSDKKSLSLQESVNIQKPFLHAVENPKNKGYDSIFQRYYAYSAIEDFFTLDIGDGLKLTEAANPKLLKIYNSQTDERGLHYITKEQHDNAINQRLSIDYDNSKTAYNRIIKETFGEYNAWDKLNAKEKAYLMDFEYNVKGGVATFPNLMKAMFKKDVEAIKNESLRYEIKRDKNGNVISKEPLGRNKEMLKRAEELYSD